MKETKFVYSLHRDCNAFDEDTIKSAFGRNNYKVYDGRNVDLVFDGEKVKAVEDFWNIVCRTRAIINRTFASHDSEGIALQNMVSSVVRDVELYCLIDNFSRDSDMQKFNGFSKVILWIQNTMENREKRLVDGLEPGVAYCFWLRPKQLDLGWTIIWICNNNGRFVYGMGLIQDGTKKWWRDSPEQIGSELMIYGRDREIKENYRKQIITGLVYEAKSSSLITLADCVKQALKI